MLLTEWNMEDAIAYNREEAWEEGRAQTAQAALAEGLPVEVIQKITGLDFDAIRDIQARG